MNTTHTTTKTANNVDFIELLCKFVNSRPCLDFNDYGDIKIYKAESREITKDRADFYELLNVARWRVDKLNDKIGQYLTASNDRLTYNNGKLQYITGQYYPTEYRPAANRVIKSILWRELMNAKNSDGTPYYETGHDIRKALRNLLSRRVSRLYFN
mgnify:CR=1 FL=1|jgi:hypothetical protein